MEWLTIKLVGWLLKRNLSVRGKNKVVLHILENVKALPFQSIINTNDEGQLLINGRSLGIEEARQLQAHSRSALENRALKLIREQVAFAAIALGVHKAETAEQMYFARAVLWWGQQQDELLKLLAQRQEPSLPMDNTQP